ncbi:MAG: DUF2779 domain-containing protein [Gemmatimonadota bacterium]
MIAISKTRFAAGLQCLKRLHLEAYAPRLRTAEAAGRDALAQVGIEVGVLAQQRFPGGILVEREASWDEAVALTARLVGDGTVAAIYEAAFEHAGARVRVDVLLRVAPGTFELIEVKAGSRVREHHETDLAFQLAVLAGAGPAVSRARLMLLDRDYVHPGGSPDLGRLFRMVDLTEKAQKLVPEVLQRLATMPPVLAVAAPPAVANGPQCLVPSRCPYFAHCHDGGPEHPVTDLPRLKAEQLVELTALGVDDICGIPDDFAGLTPLQERARQAVRSAGAVREPAVVDLLAAIALPAHFVDFETFAPAVPVYPGTHPFEQVPFQWSDHILTADGTLTHREFLHDDDADPREAFARSFLAATEGAASLFVYSAFEGEVLLALAGQLLHLAAPLHERRKRIVDLLPLVREHCYHPALRGSFSIKTVLPAFVPELGYGDLVIRDGLTASRSHATLIDPTLDPERRRELRAQLLAYCGRDTEAMVALYRVLGAPIAPAGIAPGSLESTPPF